MATQTGGRALSVEADLEMMVNGHRAVLTGRGSTLTLATDSPAQLWAELNRAELPSGIGSVNGPRAIGRAAELLADQGLRVEIAGPTGTLVSLGTGTPSRLGRLTTGSSAVQLGSIRTLAPTVVSVVRQTLGSLVSRLRHRA